MVGSKAVDDGVARKVWVGGGNVYGKFKRSVIGEIYDEDDIEELVKEQVKDMCGSINPQAVSSELDLQGVRRELHHRRICRPRGDDQGTSGRAGGVTRRSS
eukprot:762036-Hanusia_phi.AAC.1